MDSGSDARWWRTIRAAFDEAIALPPAERAARLRKLGEVDPALGDAVRDLLVADDRAGERLEAVEKALLPRSHGEASCVQQSDPFGLTGRTLAHFRILDLIGSGGMGLVYRAEDMRLARTVALKVPLPDYRPDGATRERFLREARAAAALDHPNVCSIHEAGESPEGHLYLAMPLYEGETLKDLLERQSPVPVWMALDIAGQLAEGLAAAHDAAIVHRDVKPGNIMLLPGGTVKILDFGLAKVRDQLSVSRRQLGTVAYMSPEQIRREPVDGRADLWALGVVLYEMLTGQRPFEGEHEISIAHAILRGQPTRPSALRSDIPSSIESLLFALLRKDPARRPTSARRVAARIAVIARSRSGRPRALLDWIRSAAGWGRRPVRLRRAATLVAACLAIVATGTILASLQGGPGEGRIDGSVAVLPLANASGDSRQDYFSDGITEELIAQLARVEGLRVAGASSTFRFKGRDPAIRDVGEALGVATVLRGSVRRQGQRIRVRAELIDAAHERRMWSATYDRELGDIFDIQDEIGRAITSALQIRLATPRPTEIGSTRSSDAYDFYLKGRFFWNQRTEEALVTATEYFRRAVATDPNYARAYSGLADVEIAPRPTQPVERFERARGAAARALALDSTLPEAHASMAWIQMWQDRDWPAAAGHFRRALELSSTHAWAVAWYAAYLAAVGEIEESLSVIHRAHELDPLSYVVATYVGTHYLWFGRVDEAEAWFSRALELAPDYFMAHWGLARVRLAQGRYEEALRELEYEGSDYAGVHRAGLLGYAHALAGHESEARRQLAGLHDRASRGLYVPAVDLALIHIGLGATDEALDWLERFEEDRGARVFFIDPVFDPVRGDPRFARILESLRLPPSLAGSAPAQGLPRISRGRGRHRSRPLESPPG